ncbi:BREX-1 system adenine-specific DNA-methyltransferase PglX [Salmonella enterica subsp. enterica serovar Agona]|uniref:BREX-1 system adenine-specific DNA-methyltransferase PglX n=1 Tax=Escherichia coli TaxID=562 RepID=UPI000DE8F035|nr:BREX-1 system adenine-specific DNA-methyltransferase PglX [Escherichia coli]EAA0826824.1 BREX-1 system adenine-specific DNA-methyltransferase PglX [Salmonella enterica subsp. enterica serovar Agona]EAP6904815.1 BREX-1 system adenine-specific DNA-methyltransferase PglX [Salmonella enterica]ECD7398635.1 BREX-1 system adenine-specific DNA-methyltransferase PglX [Salmonella enterica subsp. enterica serovar Westhampton]ECJ6243777.1 BREX-1 system adenine-specific DNA-methyltransferase PglX [Salmon
MNTNNIKKYAPKARREFMDAVAKRLNTFGITANKKGELQIAEANLQGSVLQIAGNSFDGKLAEPRKRIVARSQKLGYAQLIEQVAYTWFNRLCAIRYMEIHDYLGHGFRVLSHPDNPKGFEIIDHAPDAADELGLDRARIIELKLAGNKDEELYRELLLGQCHKLHEAMPFLFDALDDETELLLPDNLMRTDSILRGLVDGIPEEDWQQVEVIGWLYQFYISEKKDQVIGKVVKSEDIPAATQLFTPNWIVKYLVQNSVGRQWLQTYPDSAIKSQMEYYIEPAQQSDEVNQQLKAITPESIEPETIKVLDPACGSGHILIEAYNVLKAIYEERGFRSRDIPKMILENNLYGLDIDDRAAQLSGFALMMMARDDDKRIFTRNVRLNVLSLQESNHIDLPTLWKALNLSGSWQSGTSQGLFSDDEQDLSSFNADNRYQLLTRTLARFTQAKTFGSLIDVPSDDHEQLKELMSTLVELQESGDSMQKPAAKQLIEFVHQALVLSVRYDAVIANPPYMGSKGMNSELKEFAKKNFPNNKSDLFAIFIERGFSWLKEAGFNSMVTMQSWMFLSSYEQMRDSILSHKTIENMVHMGNGVMKIAFGTSATIFRNIQLNGYKGFFSYADNKDINEDGVPYEFPVKNNRLKTIIAEDLKRIPGNPIAYWAEDSVSRLFDDRSIDQFASVRQGMATTDNERFLRYWYEIDTSKIVFDAVSTGEACSQGYKWFPYNKGGSYRKWYGNFEYVVNYEDDGSVLIDLVRNKYPKISDPEFVIKNRGYYCKEGVTWSDVTSGVTSFRYLPQGFIFDGRGSSIFSGLIKPYALLGYLNTPATIYFAEMLNPTSVLNPGEIKKLPAAGLESYNNISAIERAVEITKLDWDESEFSWGFECHPLLKRNAHLLSSAFEDYSILSQKNSEEILSIEKSNNQYVYSLLGMDAKEFPEVNIKNITLNSNVYYRYGSDSEFGQLNARFCSDVLSDLISYSVGCMMGRYSLDRQGLVFAHSSNDGFDLLLTEGAYDTFPADEDGIIPLTDQEWFKDDATNRFREFVQVVWGEEHLQENLDFVAESLCLYAIKPKKSESALETIRRYLSTQFYKDHLKTYKKRPIYWLFSSGKQKAFECLVYLHRYNEGTLSRMRTEYVTPLLGKYDAYAEQLEKQIETADSTSEANRFKKELDALIKKQVELREFDDKLKHYADMRISLDLDDGVKVNYGKFGDLLADVKAITGSAPEVN